MILSPDDQQSPEPMKTSHECTRWSAVIDDSCVFQFDPETKRGENAGFSRPVEARRSKSQVKTMLIAFFDSRNLIHNEFVSHSHKDKQLTNIIIAKS